MAEPAPAETPAPERRGRRRLRRFLALAVIAASAYVYVQYFAGGSAPPPGVNDVTPDDAKQQSTLVDQEDQRIMETHAVLTSTLQKGGPQAAAVRQPHNASSANGRTLVLPSRSKPYFVADLQRYGQQDFQKQRDGSYLLGVNVFVAEGAKLVLQSATGPLTIRMNSIPGAFTSIVAYGGSIRVNGSALNPVRIMSWNPRTARPDTKVADGRAYVRSIGGEFRMKFAQVSHLGFWSGRTGGIALTGTDRPDTAAEPTAQRLPASARRSPTGGSDTSKGGRDVVNVTGAGGAGGGGAFQVPAATLATGSIEDSTISGDAYGVFASAANQVQILRSRIDNSLVHGVQMHRFARNSSIENTTVTGSRGDGFVLSRATESVRVTGCVALRNGGNGFTLNGQALAAGPSASGESLRAFGNNSVTSSTADSNARYGVELLGGSGVAVQTSRILGGDMGVVISHQAAGVQVTGNELRGQRRQGIVLRGGVVGAKVAGNVVNGTQTAIYLRDSSGSITGNTVQSASRHGVTLIGKAGGSQITGNTFSGAGTSVFDTRRARGPVANTGNNTHGWRNTAGLWTQVKRIAKPMNIIWTCVFLLIIVSAVRSRGVGPRIGLRGVHPYDHQRPLPEGKLWNLRRGPAAGPAGDSASVSAAAPDRRVAPRRTRAGQYG
jgi:parallel beta-helix repeat protein